MSRKRRHFTAEQKAQIVRRHLSGQEPVSQLAEEFGVQPSLIPTWVNQVLAQAERAFERGPSNGRAQAERAFERGPSNGRAQQTTDRQLEQLRAKLADKNEVLAELMEAGAGAKKELGEL